MTPGEAALLLRYNKEKILSSILENSPEFMNSISLSSRTSEIATFFDEHLDYFTDFRTDVVEEKLKIAPDAMIALEKHIELTQSGIDGTTGFPLPASTIVAYKATLYGSDDYFQAYVDNIFANYFKRLGYQELTIPALNELADLDTICADSSLVQAVIDETRFIYEGVKLAHDLYKWKEQLKSLKAGLEFDPNELTKVVEDEQPIQNKLVWKGSPSEFGYLIDQLIDKGYIARPTRQFTKAAKLYLSLFDIDTTQSTLEDEVNPKSNSLSPDKKANFKIK